MGLKSKKEVSQATAPVEDDDSDELAVPVATEVPTTEEGKGKLILSLIKQCLNVKDIANLRLSLPASLMEPVPNLEYWTVGDRADMLASIGDSPDPLERMLAVLRFAFTIQLKFVRGNVVKPYNSVLGEHFRCHWEVPPSSVDPKTSEPIIKAYPHSPNGHMPAQSGGTTPVKTTATSAAFDDNSSIRSSQSSASFKSSKSTAEPDEPLTSSMQTLSVSSSSGSKPVKVGFLCEQVSHHPPISSAYYSCPEKGIEAYGVDQISAKVAGMTVRIGPGSLNKGTFVKLNRPGPGNGEEYQVSNPQANVNGLLKGQFYGTISDSVYITCRGGDAAERYRAIIEYKDESWISKPKFLLEGVVYKYNIKDAERSEKWSRIKDIPSGQVVGTIEGCWRQKIMWKRKGEKESRVLVDLDILSIIPKTVRPLSSQDDFESRKLWDSVTQKMLDKNWGEATGAKQEIEQAQRDRTKERKEKGEEFQPRYFEADISDGRPRLTEAGRKAMAAELAGEGY